MHPMNFNSENEVFKYLHDLCRQGKITEECQFIIAEKDQKYFLENVDIKTKTKAERIKFNFYEEEKGNILVFIDPKRNGFDIWAFSKKFKVSYLLDSNMSLNYQSFDDCTCQHFFPVDTEAIANSLLQIKNYFSKKLQSS
jgi:hypothetical protein